MTSSPSKQAGLPVQQVLSSPRSAGRLRQMKSAHNLSTTYNHGPSLISQQRQQQQQLQQGSRIPSNSGIPAMPALPHRIPSPPKHESPSKQGRTRANSDLPPSSHNTPEPSPNRRTAANKRAANPKDELDALIRSGPKRDLPLALQNLRHWILCDGMDADSDGMSHLRIYVWLILLNAPPIPTDTYLSLTHRGPSPAHAKICNDTFRTFKTNPLFKRRVTDNSLVRLLNAVAWSLYDAKQEQREQQSITTLSESGRLTNSSTDLGSPEMQHSDLIKKHMQLRDNSSGGGGVAVSTTDSVAASEAGGSSPGIYVQGMNVLCAPFLYAARSEPEAYVAFHRFITRECPGYVRGAMDGVHKGITLVDRCLAIIDPKLSHYLLSKGVKAEVYAFASVLTMCACTPPLPEVLQLWDFLLAYGPHLNILCVCSQLIAMREALLGSASPGTLLRAFPALEARKIVMLTVGMVAKVPEGLYEDLVHHAQ